MPIPHFKRYEFRCDNIGGLIYVTVYNSVTGRRTEHELTPATYRRFVRIANESGEFQPEILEGRGDFGWSLMRRWTPRGRKQGRPKVETMSERFTGRNPNGNKRQGMACEDCS